jgi:hypothetical protein
MDSTYLPAVAALAGSAIGGLTSFASAWLTQNRQDRARRLSQDKARRQKLYRQFIDEASKLYADAVVHDQVEVSALVSIFALVSRMRVLSSSAVVEKAEAVNRMIVDTYFEAKQDISRAAKPAEEPSDRSATGLQRGMPCRIAGSQGSLSARLFGWRLDWAAYG